ncbi:CpaF family protein [Blastopirellula marina]|uniref:CpaF family protein n=1 Tax=Blastopirellula marina TaxID=124 RepID=A0A2S8G2J1_9BACT|nr:CpaF family protein [Blastopirellula marina]PQO38520.1 CpaF family protein [Blastopirellula marina]PTL45177.1 CpaF family protein [Blastopirellula marina]
MTELERQATQTFGRDRRLQELKESIHEKLISSVDISVVRSVNQDELRNELRRGAAKLCNFHSDLLTQVERNRIIDELVDEALGLGPLEPLMHDPTVSDILINGPDSVYVERRGKLEATDVRFRSVEHLLEIVQRMASRVGRRIDESSPMVDARLPDGSRLNAVIRPLALEGALVSIRRFATKPFRAEDLVTRHTASPQMMEFLKGCVKARLNILISGGTGSGKSTLLNTLSGYIPDTERIATIEDAAELQLQQPHIARMETRPPNLEGKGQITSRDLLINALRMRPDRIIIGECRSVEAFDMLQAMNTGHDGGMSTIHANDARDALTRLEMLVGMAAPELPMHLVHRQVASAIHVIVQVARLSSGERKIIQISEVTGVQGGTTSMHDLFIYRQMGVNPDGTLAGQFEGCGIRPNCFEKLRSKGIELPLNTFSHSVQHISRIDGLKGI